MEDAIDKDLVAERAQQQLELPACPPAQPPELGRRARALYQRGRSHVCRHRPAERLRARPCIAALADRLDEPLTDRLEQLLAR